MPKLDVDNLIQKAKQEAGLIEKTLLRKEDEPGFDKEIKLMSWHCYCCQDTGLIPYSNYWGIVNDSDSPKAYDPTTMGDPICNRLGCNISVPPAIIAHSNSSWSSELCEMIHTIQKETWMQETIERIRLHREYLFTKIKSVFSEDSNTTV